MALEASFTIDRDAFPLSAVFEQLPEAAIELDRVVPTADAVIPYCWIHADDVAALNTDLQEDIGIDGVHVIDEVEDQLLLRIDWNLDHDSILTAIVDTEVSLLSGYGDEAQWTFELRAEDHEQLADFQAYCQERNIDVELTQLHALAPIQPDREYDLTEGQRDALILAYNRGHFDSPQQATQQDLADELDLSRQAVASRLHRGIRRLVADTILLPDEHS